MPGKPLMPLGCLPFIVLVWFIFFLPFFLANVMMEALAKLSISAQTSVSVIIWIFMGGLINIPLRKVPRPHPQEFHPYHFFGMDRWVKEPVLQNYTTIAVNVGGCVVPVLICLYEVQRIAALGTYAVLACALSTAINIAVCYRFAKPVPKLGIVMPPLIPALAAAICALVFLPQFAPPIAFVSGVLGCIVGADLMHLKDITRIDTPIASIGGAGTFDGIIITGLFATILV